MDGTGKVCWGVLSTASIGRLVIEATRTASQAAVVAVASRDAARGRAFADDLGLEAAFGSYEELLASAVEGLMWRHHPQTALARRLVADGAIGRLAYVRAALSVRVPAGDIRRSVELGGGALGDLGCYCVSGIRLVGTEGRLTVPDPWLCRASHLELSRDGARELVPVGPDGGLGLADPEHDVYRIELDTVSAAIAGGGELPFGRADAVAQAGVLEALHRSAELATPIAPGR